MMQREVAFNKIFEGQKAKLSRMFGTVSYYSPTGLERKVILTKNNVSDYNRFVIKHNDRRKRWQNF